MYDNGHILNIMHTVIEKCVPLNRNIELFNFFKKIINSAFINEKYY